jgi:hypothetical protein
MIATIVGTATSSVTAITTSLRRSINLRTATRKAKGGAWRLPLLLFYYVVSEAR